jgi:rSAM/selenodomain-associated transferase 2
LNEEDLLPKAFASLMIQNQTPFEIIVVDGGSEDRTLAIAGTKARVYSSAPGIARQMNLGAGQATGDVLLFLHADCHLEPGAMVELQETLSATNAVVGGAFRHRIHGNRPLLDWWLSVSGTLNARWSGYYLGDHGIFCRRKVFEAIGGFPDIPLLYELPFMKKLRASGQLVQLKKHCITSGRKFQNKGYFTTMLLMRALRLSYRFGLPYRYLTNLYLGN